jgi:hypothetical protein
MLARPGTSDADFEAINACFQAPLEGASAFEFMNLRIPGLSALGFPWAVRGFHHDEWLLSPGPLVDEGLGADITYAIRKAE